MLLMRRGPTPGVGPTGWVLRDEVWAPCDFIYRLFVYFMSRAYELRCRQIMYPFRSPRRAHCNGGV
jgi:hypothetical protein